MADRHKTKPKAVRMPGGLLAWYEAEAKRTSQTVNGLLVAALEEHRQREGGGSTTPVTKKPARGSGSTTEGARRCTHPGKRVIGGYCPQCDAVVQPGGGLR